MERVGNESEGKPSSARKAERPTLLVFHVNDRTDDQVLFQTACKMAKVPFVWHVADSSKKALSYLETLVKINREHPAAWPDLVVLDLHMPGGNGFEVLQVHSFHTAIATAPGHYLHGLSRSGLREEGIRIRSEFLFAKTTRIPEYGQPGFFALHDHEFHATTHSPLI